MSIDLNTHSMGGCRIDNSIHIQFVPGPAQQQATCRVSNNVDIGISDGSQHAFGLLSRRKLEVTVNRGNDKIQRSKHIVSIVKRTILENVAFAPFENTQATGIFFVEAINLLVLATQVIFSQTTCIGSCFAMVADAQIQKATCNARLSQFANSVLSITPRRVDMQYTA